MITDYPTPLATFPEERAVTPRGNAPAGGTGSWHYDVRHGSRSALVAAILISAGLHVVLLFGANLLHRKPKVKPVEEAVPVIRLSIPDLKELEEPETSPNEDTSTLTDAAIPVPMQADLPQLPRPSDFVQALNFSSLIEQPDLSAARISIIPENFTRGTRIAESIGKIFNLEDLERHPEPTFQPAPVYPFALRREGLTATVSVEVIVDAQGRVLEPIIVSSTHSGFDEAAVVGVARW